MMIENRLREIAALCLSSLRRYHDAEKTAATRAAMAAEIGAVVGRLTEFGPSIDVTQENIFTPVEDYLVARYGHEAGLRLNAAFVEAFEAAESGAGRHAPVGAMDGRRV